MDRDYILGTHEAEVARLGLQHRVWRPRALDAWRRAGFTTGQTLLDVGCGPGHASFDLAEIVGPAGRIIALDRSRRFLDALESERRRRGLDNITTVEGDLDGADLVKALGDAPVAREGDGARGGGAARGDGAHGAWVRWVFAFVQRPRDLLTRLCGALKPGGALVIHEYLDYATWRLAPRSPEHEEFVRLVMESWRRSGGEPDIGLDLPAWLEEEGFEIKTLTPIVDVVPPSNFVWQWPKAFIEVGLRRMVDLGHLTEERARAVGESFAAREAAPRTLMITPAVIEILAVRR